jgi:PhnB protein
VFAALGQGGKVTMVLTKTFWTSSFGMLADKFGVPWMVNVAAPKA